MANKVNVKESKVKIEDLVPRPNRAERRRAARAGNELTETEKIQFAIIVEKLNLLENQVQQVRVALAGLITSTVELRGLDPVKFGVNLGAGRILPVDGQESKKEV